jgi:YVTN family beta-propeller protein
MSANGGTYTVSVIYTATNTVIDTIAVGGAPQGVAVSSDATRPLRHQRNRRHGVGDQCLIRAGRPHDAAGFTARTTCR